MYMYRTTCTFQIAYAQEVGISSSKASLVLLGFGGSTAMGRVFFGWLLSKGIIDRLRMDQLAMVCIINKSNYTPICVACVVYLCIFQIVSGTGVILLPNFFRTFEALMVYVVIVGVVDGCYVVLLPTLTETFTCEDQKVVAWGILNFFASVTFTLGPVSAGACGCKQTIESHHKYLTNTMVSRLSRRV